MRCVFRAPSSARSVASNVMISPTCSSAGSVCCTTTSECTGIAGSILPVSVRRMPYPPMVGTSPAGVNVAHSSTTSATTITTAASAFTTRSTCFISAFRPWNRRRPRCRAPLRRAGAPEAPWQPATSSPQPFHEHATHLNIGDVGAVNKLFLDLLHKLRLHRIAMHALKLGEVAVVRRQAFEHRIVVDEVRLHLHHVLVVEGHLGILNVDGVAHAVVALHELPQLIALAVVRVFRDEVRTLNRACLLYTSDAADD